MHRSVLQIKFNRRTCFYFQIFVCWITAKKRNYYSPFFIKMHWYKSLFLIFDREFKDFVLLHTQTFISSPLMTFDYFFGYFQNLKQMALFLLLIILIGLLNDLRHNQQLINTSQGLSNTKSKYHPIL